MKQLFRFLLIVLCIATTASASEINYYNKSWADIVAKAAQIVPDEIFIASTGVIGEPLEAAKFSHVINELVSKAASQTLDVAARAIMTTDTYPKLASQTVSLDGQAITIAGIAKGAGMIAPDMATMLSFIFTDAPIAANVLQGCLAREVAGSFNAITVDGDTSTSDTVLLFSTGKQQIAPVTDIKDPRVKSFRKGLRKVLLDLAHQVVKDGEGATKFVEVAVQGATSAKSAKKIAFAIANSPLVKTAIAGEDANWGRIVMAVGKAGEPADRDKLSISFGDFVLAEQGERAPYYDEAMVSAYMREQVIKIGVDLHLGKGKATVWTCDLTKAYVEINGDYRS